MEYTKLVEILKEINVLPDLSIGNIIKQIKTKLQQEDSKTYEEWEKEKFNVNHLFTEQINPYLDLLCTVRRTLLNIAAQNGCTEVVKILIESNANVNAKSSYNEVPLFIAARKGHIEIVKILITNKADVDAKNHTGITPLSTASEEGHTEIVKTLLAKGATVNTQNDNRWTPLHFAAKKGHIEIVKTLLAKGAIVNAIIQAKQYIVVPSNRHNDGKTPLHLAAKKGHIDVVKTLLENGANPLLKDLGDRTPRDLAEHAWHLVEDIIQLLKKAEKRQLIKDAIVKGIVVGFVSAVIAATALTFATTLPVPAIIGLATGSALIVSGVVSVGAYMISKPKAGMNVEQVAPNGTAFPSH